MKEFKANKVNAFKYLDVIAYVFLINFSLYLVLNTQISFNFFAQRSNIYLWLATIITLLEIIFFNTYGLFSLNKKSFKDSIYSLGLSIILINFLTWFISLFDRNFIYPRNIFLILVIYQFFILGAWTIFSWKVQKKLSPIKNLMIIGEREEVENIMDKLSRQKNKNVNIKYICNNIEILEDYIEEVDEIVVCSGILDEYKEPIINYCINHNKELYIVPEIYDIAMTSSKLEEFDDMPVLKISSFNISFGKRVVKRLFDIIISSICIIILSPIMLVVAIMIKSHDKGPILYKQKRVTNENREFELYKFRTMIVDAEKMTGPVLATDKDPRITPVGRVLRSTRLDELPQLFNVLKGDMSIVGPRPERDYFIKEFTKEMPEFRYRTAVKAGITGLAQVLGKYTTTPEDKLKYDLMYIKNYSLLLDFKILIQTVKVIFIKESSQGVVKDKGKEKLFKELDVEGFENSGIVKF